MSRWTIMLLEILFCIILRAYAIHSRTRRERLDRWGVSADERRKIWMLPLYLKIFLEFTCSVYASDFIGVIAVSEIHLNWFTKSIFHKVKLEKFWCVCLWEFSELTNFVIVRLETTFNGLLNAECFQLRLRTLRSFVWPFFCFSRVHRNVHELRRHFIA